MPANSASALEIPDNVKAARQKVQTSNFFGLCYLMLCQLSYLGEDEPDKALDRIRTELPNMPIPDGVVEKPAWRLDWGPVASDDNSNLMYAAKLIDLDSTLPIFSAVVIRGTDVEAEPAGLVKQLIEDLDAEDQVPLPFPNSDPNAKIANGTKIGFETLIGPKFLDPVTHKNVEGYVSDFLNANPGAPVVVTGHSLGGCQTTVMALDLALKSPNAVIVSNTFAAPTAGNAAFANLYQQKCKSPSRWFNDIDLVPKAYADLDGIKALWDTCHRSAPLLIKIAVEGLELLLKDVSYVQPDNNQRELRGECQPPGTDPIAAGIQNETVLQIDKILKDHVAKLQGTGRLSDVLPAVKKDLGSLLVDLEHLLHPLTDAATLIINKASLEDITNWVLELLFQHLIMTGYWKTVEHTDGVGFIPIPKAFLKAAAAAGIA